MANIQQYIDQFTRFVGSKAQVKAKHKALLEKFVSWEVQALDETQKQQAQTNIGVHSPVTLAVGSDPELSLTGQELNLDLSTLRQIKYNPTTLTVNTGTLIQGTVADLAAVGGTDVIVQETTGSDPLRVTLGFTGVNRLNAFNFFGRYSGGANHVVYIQAYDYVAATWETVGEIGNNAAKGWFSFNLFLSERFIASENVSIRFNHQGTGINTHQLILDYVDVSWGGGGGSYNDHATLANLGWTNSNHSGTANYTPVFSATGTPALSPVQLTAAGSVNIPTGQTYQINGTSLLLSHLLSGSLGASGTIPISAGASLSPVWTSVYGAIATGQTAGYLPKFGASKLENSIIQQVGTFIGINKTPAAAFDVNGNIRANNTISFPRALDQTYTASVGTNNTTFNELLIEVTGGGSQIWFKTNGLLRHIINQDGNEFIGTNTLTGTIGRVTIKGSTTDGSSNIIVGRDSNEVNVYRLDTDGNATHSGYVSATTAKLTTGAAVDYFWKCTNIDGSGAWTALPSQVYPAAGIAVSTGTAWGTSITDNSTNWNTAYGWGNHAAAGYQAALVSGTNIKTINSTSLLGAGDISITGLPSGVNGDILYYNSGWQKLAKGTDGQVLTIIIGLPSWAAVTASQWTTDTNGITYNISGKSVGIGTVSSSLSSLLVSRNLATNSYVGQFVNLNTSYLGTIMALESVNATFNFLRCIKASTIVFEIDSTGTVNLANSIYVNGSLFLDSSRNITANSFGVGAQTIVSSAGVANFASLKIGGTERISSAGVFNPSNGVTGTWTTVDGKTITSTNGIITSIV